MRVTETFRRDGAVGRQLAGAVPAGFFLTILLLALAGSVQAQTPEETGDVAVEPGTVASDAADLDAAETNAADSPAAEISDAVDDDEAAGQPQDELLSSDVEEIVIQAEAYSGTARDAAISTVGFDMETLSKEGIHDIRDLSNFTPSLEIKSAFAASNPTIFIRGVGLDDFNANAASAVAIYQDGVYMQSPAGQLFQFYDVEGVEVLRGPQGALYRSASAGAILVRSQKPTDEFEAYVEGTYGNYDYIQVTGAISGPIVPDLLSGRLAGSWGIRDGVTKNRCGTIDPSSCKVGGEINVEPGLNEWTNDIDAYAGRGQLLMRPLSYDGEWLLNFHGGQNFSRAFQYQHRGVKFIAPDLQDDPDVPAPRLPIDPPRKDANNYVDQDGDPFAGDYDIDGPELLNLYGTNLKGNWRFGDSYELESITAYEWHDRFTLQNSDASPVAALHTEFADTAWQVSQEFKLRGEWVPTGLGDGDWILGTYYLQEDLDVDNFFIVGTGAAVDLHQFYSQNMRNFAVYGQSEYTFQPGCISISCDFKLTTGLRYNVEYKEFDIFVCSPDFLTPGAPPDRSTDNCRTSLEGKESDLWSGLSGEATLAWLFREESNVYIKYSRGWKGGHFNGGAVAPFEVITSVDPETVDSYEFGLRSVWLDDRISINSTAFYYDYQDLQVFQLEQTPSGFPISKLENASDAVVYGIELDMIANPVPDLTLTFNAAWVESEYTEFIVALPFQIREDRQGGGPRPPAIKFLREFDYSGNPLIASPRFSMTGTITYNILLPGGFRGHGMGTLTPRFSFSWKDDVFFDAGRGQGALLNFPEATFGQEAFWVFNSALSWRSDNERFEVTGWVHNFLDEHYKTQSDDLHRAFALLRDAYADPRTYGITVSLSY